MTKSPKQRQRARSKQQENRRPPSRSQLDDIITMLSGTLTEAFAETSHAYCNLAYYVMASLSARDTERDRMKHWGFRNPAMADPLTAAEGIINEALDSIADQERWLHATRSEGIDTSVAEDKRSQAKINLGKVRDHIASLWAADVGGAPRH